MRRIVFFAVMVMLVLRGLVGGVMAAGAAPVLPVQEAPTPHTVHGAHGDPADDHHAVAPQACDGTCHNATATDGDSPHRHNASCTACDICHSAMLTAPTLSLQFIHAPGAAFSDHAIPFASIAAARAIKPPIA